VLSESQRCYKIARETPSAETLDTRGVGKICDFRPKSPFISKVVRHTPMVLMTLSDVERRDAKRGPNL